MYRPDKKKIPMVLLLSVFVARAAGSGSGIPVDRNQGNRHAGMTIRPDLEVTTSYDSNIFATQFDRENDYLTLVAPTMELRSLAASHALILEAGALLGRYWENSNENFDDYWLSLRGKYTPSEPFRVFGAIGTRGEHEGRDSPEDDLSGDEPTTLESHNADLGAVYGFGPNQLRFGGTAEALRFDDISSAGGTLINSDRDRNRYGISLRFMRRLAPRTRIFVQTQYDSRNYLKSTDISGFRRDSHGQRAALGVKHGFGDSNSVEAYFGYLGQRYDDARFDNVNAADFAATLQWQIGAQTQLTAELQRDLQETTQFGASGYLQTDFDLALSRRINEHLVATINGYYGFSDYQQIDREDKLLSLGASLEYAFSPSLFAIAEYQWTQRDSNDLSAGGLVLNDTFDFDRYLVSLTLGARFPAKSGR